METPDDAPLQAAAAYERFLAFAADAFLIALLAAAVGIFFIRPADPHLHPNLLGVCFAGLFFLYHGALAAAFGATPGKRLLSIRAVAPDGGALTPARSFLRAFGYFLSIATFGLGFLWALLSRDKRALEDYLGASRVIRTRQKGLSERIVTACAAGLIALACCANALRVPSPALEPRAAPAQSPGSAP